MSNNYDPTVDQAAQNKRRKRKALLASGAVLGIGAVITLAAWNDSVWGFGEFGVGDAAWNLQGSTVALAHGDAGWTEYDTANGAAIAFTLDDVGIDVTNMMPGSTATGSLWVTEQYGNLDSILDVRSAVLNQGTNNVADALQVTISADKPGGAGGTGTLRTAGLTGVQLGTEEVVKLTFTVTLPSNTNPSNLSSDTVTAAWQVYGTSVDS
ncbi:SipW-dependent-type signal peptide-containing protein [Gordonia sp. CPCC 206044]|uniref:SipW-dependent-type signal peptide-containing protein n=1 Tax=Gordonia sp. CPCC 206044 TaxID=3140793 RepID=UPI003AF369F9